MAKNAGADRREERLPPAPHVQRKIEKADRHADSGNPCVWQIGVNDSVKTVQQRPALICMQAGPLLENVFRDRERTR